MSAIYIQHSQNHAYFYGEDRWVLGRKRARRFARTHEALAFALDRDLVYAQVRVCFGPGAADVVIPVERNMAVAAAHPTGSAVWE
jgi:hypothetical protein